MNLLAAPSRSILLLSLSLTVLLTACGSSPTVKFYTLSPGSPTTQTGNTDLSLAIGPVEFPRSLARSQIVTRVGSTQMDVDEYNVWSAPLETQFLQVLGDNLGSELGTHQIAVYPKEAAFPVKYRLLMDVLQFDGVKGDSVTLRARWTILQADGSAVSSGLFNKTQVARGDGYDGLVAAHSALIANLAKTLATELRS